MRADKKQTITPEQLDQLARQYQDEGLPLPPTEAPLMVVFAGSWSQDAEGKTTPSYFLGYRLEAGESKTKPGTFLVGTEIYEPEIGTKEADRPPQAIDPDKPLPPHLLKEWWNGPSFPVNVWLAVAIQSHLRGYDKLARQIFERGLASDGRSGGPTAVSSGRGWVDPTANHSMAKPPAGGGPGESLAATAWNHWMNAAIKPGANDAAILARLEKLLDDHPALAGDNQRAFVESLRLKLRPSQSQPGSVEGLIDGLTEFAVTGGRISRSDPTSDPNYDKLQTMGFAAVPALLEHLDDRRLTRSVTVGFNNFRTLPRRVGEVVSDLIEDLAGPELGQDWLARQLGNSAEATPVRQWWEKARALGEEAYVCSRVFPVQKQENDEVNLACLRIVADRYPQRLGEIYLRLLKERPDLGSSQVAKAIADSESLGREDKLRLLRHGADHPDLDRSEDALTELLKLGRVDAEAWLVTELEHLPADVEQAYWRCPEARISSLVLQSDSPAVWKAFERAAKRAAVGLRMELMAALSYTAFNDAQRKERLACLAAFLDDDTLRTVRKGERSGKYDGPCAAFTFPSISVANFAAMQIGTILGVPERPEEKWSRVHWARYRAKVRAALAKA